MIRTLIVDDERLARQELSNLLKVFPEIEIVGEATNADEGIDKIEELKPQLIFLDIQMPGKTGFEMLEDLLEVPYVIFSTAYDEFALKAFEVNALDYLLKPVDGERLKAAVEKAVHQIVSQAHEQEADGNQQKRLKAEDQVFVKDGDKCWFVRLEDVRLFESVGNYIKLHFEDQRPLIHKSLNKLADRLDEKTFFRANRQQIINLNWVTGIQSWFSGGLLVELRGGEKIELSRRQAVKFREMKSL